MTNLLNTLLVAVLMLNLFSLGASRIVSVIRVVSLQGALLGLLPLLLHEHSSWSVIVTIVLMVLLKGFIIPWMMTRALRDAKIKREVDPLIGLQPSVFLGALGTVFALFFAEQLPLAERHTGVLVVPAAVATVLTGFILLVTRFKALTQIMGYLVLENGIFMFGMLLVDAMPLVVEMGVLLDLFVAIFVICIIMNRINQAFSSLDTRRLVSLKE